MDAFNSLELFRKFPVRRSVHCSNHSPRGILIHPVEDLWLILLPAPLLRARSFYYSHCSLGHRVRLSQSAPPQPLPTNNQRGIWRFLPGVDAATATNIPVVVINGAKRGPVLALVSGAHGTEYTSIIAIEKLISQLDPSQIAGTVILVPLVNIQSFEQKVPHVNPIDNKSMNRS